MAHQQSKLDQTNKQIAGAESLLAETGSRMTMEAQNILDRVANPRIITEEDKALALPA